MGQKKLGTITRVWGRILGQKQGEIRWQDRNEKGKAIKQPIIKMNRLPILDVGIFEKKEVCVRAVNE